MATTITPATLTVTITEAVTLNGYDQGSSNSFTVASVNDVVKRIVEIPTAETGLIGFDSASLFSTGYVAGQFDEGSVRYVRITNKDDTNHVELVVRTEGNAEFALLLDAKGTFLLPCDQAGGVVNVADADSSALTVTLEDVVDITAKADTAAVDVEVFVASA